MDIEISKIMYDIHISHMDFRHVTLSYTSTLLGLNFNYFNVRNFRMTKPQIFHGKKLSRLTIFLNLAVINFHGGSHFGMYFFSF